VKLLIYGEPIQAFGDQNKEKFVTSQGITTMQPPLFYCEGGVFPASGNAPAFHLPGSRVFSFFGQCNRLSFTGKLRFFLFRAMHPPFIYREAVFFPFSGNATAFHLPQSWFFPFFRLYGLLLVTGT
jgi:hypothetical protein